jgi:hypothetical protein
MAYLITNYREFGQVMTTTRRLFNSSFTNSRVEFNKRQVNGVAHALAPVVPYSVSPAIYIDVPPCIEQFIANDIDNRKKKNAINWSLS